MTKQEREALDVATNAGWLVFPKQSGNLRLHNAWYRLCREQNRPFIHVTKRRRWAQVWVDMISTDKGKLPQEAANEAREMLFAYTQPRGMYHFGVVTMGTNKVENERAEELAAKLHAVVTSPRPVPESAPATVVYKLKQ